VGYNKKVIGLMKDESAGIQITEFVALQNKCYAYTVDEKEMKKDKGIKKVVVKKHLTVKDYRDVLYSHHKIACKLFFFRADMRCILRR
jgi:hypothetical protein